MQRKLELYREKGGVLNFWPLGGNTVNIYAWLSLFTEKEIL